MILTVEAPVREALVTKMTVQMKRAGVFRYMGEFMVKHVVLYLIDNGWTHEPTVRQVERG